MKRAFAITLIMAMALSLCAGCQKTPESPIVVGKNVEKMIDTARKDETKAPSDEAAKSMDLYEKLNVPQRYAAQFDSEKGRLHVLADATVLLPDSELPIVRVKPVEFTQEQARQFAQALMGDDARYVKYDFDTLSKGVYERKINRLRYGLTDWENIGQPLFDLQYYTKEEAEAALTEFLAKLEDAPAAFPEYTPSFEWEHMQTWKEGVEVEDDQTYMRLYSTIDNSTYSYLEIRNTRALVGTASMVYIRDFDMPMDTLYGNRKYTGNDVLGIETEDALKIAQQTIKRMGVTDFVCSASGVTSYRNDLNMYKPAYYFIFTRQVNEVAETCTGAECIYDNYNTNWYYESIRVLVDDAGILRLEYHSPYEITEIVMNETELLSFDQIKAIFEKMAVIVDNEVDNNEMWAASGSMEYHITKVQLGLVSIREKDQVLGLLVPAWDFLGYTRARMSEDNAWTTASTDELRSFLTINAIDGNIIERGY